MHKLTLCLLFTAVTAMADSATLDRIAESGVFNIGYVPDAPPLSFDDDQGNAAGYSIDLCRHIARAVREELGLERLDIRYTALVSMEERIGAVERGDVDIECGATTVTLGRRERVDFTLMTYITGSAIVSLRDNPINAPEDARGKLIAAIQGTTTERVIRDFSEINEVPLRLRIIRAHDEGMRLLRDKEVDGYASDRAMLVGQVFRSENASNRFVLSRGAMSFEPYAMMTARGDTEFRLIADRALAELFRTARIRRLHQIWFGRYGESVTPIVEAMYQLQAVSD